MEHFQERFSKFENVENLFNFYKKKQLKGYAKISLMKN